MTNKYHFVHNKGPSNHEGSIRTGNLHVKSAQSFFMLTEKLSLWLVGKIFDVNKVTKTDMSLRPKEVRDCALQGPKGF